MKKIIVSMLALMSLTTYAHPDSQDGLDKIGTGTKLVSKQDINLKPGKNKFYLAHEGLNDRICFILLREATSYDRVMHAGKELIVMATKRYLDTNDFFPRKIELTVNHPAIRNISCESRKTYVTIEEFSILSNANFDLELANPEEL